MRAGGLAGLLLAAAMLLAPGPAEQAREAATDALMRAVPRPAPVGGSAPVVAIAVAEADLEALGPWPWPRERWAALVARAAAAGAVAIALDIAFVEPAAGDAALEAALAAAPSVLGLVAGHAPPPPRGFGIAVLGEPDLSDLLALPGITPLAVGGAPGAAAVLPGAAMRRVPLLLRIEPGGEGAPASLDPGGADAPASLDPGGGAGAPASPDPGGAGGPMSGVPPRDGQTALLPGLALAALARALDVATLVVRGGGEAGPMAAALAAAAGRQVVLGAAGRLPLPAGGGLLRLHPAAPAAAPPVAGAAWLLQAGQAEAAAALRGRVVLLGATAAEVAPLRPSPFGPFTPSLRIQAEAVAQLAQGWVPRRLPGGAGAEAAAALALALLAAGLVRRRTGPGLALAAALALAWIGAAAAALRLGPLLADPLFPPLGALLGGAVEAGAAALRLARERARLHARFAHRLPPGVADALLALPEAERLRPERRRVAVIITDLAGFSTMVRRVDPAAVVPLLNTYLAGIEAIVTREGGTLERLIGDGVVMVFGAPVPQPDHGTRALAAARAIDRFAEEFRRRPEAMEAGWGETRIGVAAGEVLAGEVGGSRLTWTICGDAANIAARLQELGKTLGCRALVTGIADPSLPPPLTRMALRGIPGAVEIHPLHPGALREAGPTEAGDAEATGPGDGA